MYVHYMDALERCSSVHQTVKALFEPYGIEPRLLSVFGDGLSVMVVVKYGEGPIAACLLEDSYDGIRISLKEGANNANK